MLLMLGQMRKMIKMEFLCGRENKKNDAVFSTSQKTPLF
jgi:hypothetical protein